MIPIENSVAGRVADIHHLLPESGLHIVGEWFLPIHFQLMAPPGAKSRTSRPSTATSMRSASAATSSASSASSRSFGRYRGQRAIVAEGGDKTLRRARPEARRRNLRSRNPRRGRRGRTHNTTRFVVLSREEWAAQRRAAVTTFVFRVRNVPAALYKAMGGFATNGVNMTKLESYMVGGKFFATQFYADVDGHPDDRGLALALEELGFFSREVRILGVYPAHPFRETQSEAEE